MVTNDPEKGATRVGDWVLLGFELIFILAIVYGVYQVFVPGAWVVGGLAGLLVTSRFPGFLAPVRPKKVRR